jgi:uncharacterized protein (DUF1501 family)
MKKINDRRSFLKKAPWVVGGTMLGLGPLGSLASLAQDSPSSSYQALICIFLFGGNDGNNMIVPIDNAGYSIYAAGRRGLALPQSQLIALQGTSYGVHPSMPEIATLFNGGQAAFVTNVGTLTQPLAASDYYNAGVAKPMALMSHIDQQSQWQSGTTTSQVSVGWGGELCDILQPSYGPSGIPMLVSVAGNALFSNGNKTSPLCVSTGGSMDVKCFQGTTCTERSQVEQQLLKIDSGVTLVSADQTIASSTYSYIDVFNSAVSQATHLNTTFPNTGLGVQMRQIASIIQVRNALGARKQVFFASLGGFDTHANQLSTHAALLQQLSQAVYALQQAMQELGVSNQVTAFTMSDFARTLQPNLSAGTDHAWGNHQLVIGGAVKGKQLYGKFPSLVLSGPDDIDGTGLFVPTTATAQFGATLASWFGVGDSDLNTIFPQLQNFNQRNLGFI